MCYVVAMGDCWVTLPVSIAPKRVSTTNINPDNAVPTMSPQQQGHTRLCDAVSILCEITGPHGDWCYSAHRSNHVFLRVGRANSGGRVDLVAVVCLSH